MIDWLVYIIIFYALYMDVLFLLILIDNLAQGRQIYKPKIKRKFPSVALIVPCFNEEKTIAKTVQSLIKLDWPKSKLKIIIVDDGSEDRTLIKAKNFEKYKFVKLLHKKNGGKHSALNLGLKHTRAKFVGCCDADSFVNPSALKVMVPYFEDKNIMVVAASLKIHHPQNFLQRIQRIEYLFGIFLRKSLDLANSIFVAPGPLTIFRKKIFGKVGLYTRGHFTEDIEMTLRLQKKQYKIAATFNAPVYTIGPYSFKDLWKQRIRWYQGLVRNAWDYRDLIINKKYGDFGLFIFPLILFSIPIMIGGPCIILYQLITKSITKFLLWQSINFGFNPTFSLDWFFINITEAFIISIILMILMIAMIILAKKLSFEKRNIWKDFFYFIFFYPFLNLIWWLGTIKDLIFHKNKW